MTHDAEYERYERDKEQHEWEMQEREIERLRAVLREIVAEAGALEPSFDTMYRIAKEALGDD